MKTKNRNLLASIGLLAAASLSSPLQAQVLTWDPGQTGTGSNGDGDWDNDTANWATGTGNVAIGASAQTSLTVALASGVNTLTVANPDGLEVGQTLSTDRFPAGTVITGIAGDVITLSNNSTNTHNAGQQIFFAQPEAVVFGTGEGAAGTVIVSEIQAVDGLTLDAAEGGENYIFTGDGSITVSSRHGSTTPILVHSGATFESALNWRNMTFSTAGQTVTLAGGSTLGSAVGSFNGNVSGSSNDIAKDSTLSITDGFYFAGGAGNSINIGDVEEETGGLQMSGGTITAGGNFQIGTDGGRSGFAHLTAGTINSQGQFTIGRNSITTTGRVVVDGGVINQTGTNDNDTSFAIGRSNGVGTLEVRDGLVRVVGNGIHGNSGGILVLNANGANAAASGALLIGGGTVIAKDLRFNGGNKLWEGSPEGSSSLVMTGGNLYLGGIIRHKTQESDPNGVTEAGGLRNVGTDSSTYSIDLADATIGANANWSSDLDMTLSGGVTTFRAADEYGFDFDITLTGVLGGEGALAKTGFGPLILSGGNTYEGGTTIEEGILLANNTSGSATGSGAVNVGDGATLGGTGVIGGEITIDDGATLAPGVSVGTLQASAGVTFHAGSAFSVEISGGSADRLNVAGALDIDGAELVISPEGVSASVYVIASYGSLSGAGEFAGVTGLPPGYELNYGFNGGTQIAIVQPGGGGDYSAWAAVNAGGGGFDEDFDNDGVKNGIEYFMGETGSSFTSNPQPVNGVISYPRDAIATGVSFKVWLSLDLSDWEDVTDDADSSDPAFVKYTLPAGEDKIFVRLEVIED